MKTQPSRGRVKEKVSLALVGAASRSSAVRLLSLWGCGWAGAESGQAITNTPAKRVRVFQRVGKRRQRETTRGGLFIREGYALAAESKTQIESRSCQCVAAEKLHLCLDKMPICG